MDKTAGFNEFWAAWPGNRSGGYMRKGGKQQCLQRWIKGHYCTQSESIIAHVKWLKTTTEWLKDNGAFIPMPITYLNQQRWDGADFEPVKESIDPVIETRQRWAQEDAKAVKPNAEVQAKIRALLGKTPIPLHQAKQEN